MIFTLPVLGQQGPQGPKGEEGWEGYKGQKGESGGPAGRVGLRVNIIASVSVNPNCTCVLNVT